MPTTKTTTADLLRQLEDARSLACTYEAELAELQPLIDAAIKWQASNRSWTHATETLDAAVIAWIADADDDL